MAQKDYLIGHMEDLADNAVKTGCSASRFLTPAEASLLSERFKYKSVKLLFAGGYEKAERVRAVFLNADWGESDRANLIAALKLEYRSKDYLGHRDVLGALMALGIERDTVGDIVIDENSATLVCLPEMSGFICENLTKVGRTGIKVSKIGLEELPNIQKELIIKTDTVASLRLDAVLTAAFGLSRTKAAEIISGGHVNIDHLPCMQPAKVLNEGTLLSVRGFGRAILMEVGGVSRKGRLFVRVGLYRR